MNAVRFTPVSGKMLLKACAWHDAIEFHVYDSGPGFQEGDLKKYYNVFIREISRVQEARSILDSGYILLRQLLRSMVVKFR